jgi:hypothetical protein
MELAFAKNGESVSASNQLLDYIYRNNDRQFNSMSIYDFVSYAVKITATSETTRIASRLSAGRGRHPNQRGTFSATHPQYRTHLLRTRSTPHVPVILGPTLPAHGRSDDENQAWARAMLIIFSPWRTASDLKSADKTWLQAYSRHESGFSESTRDVISNLQSPTRMQGCQTA